MTDGTTGIGTTSGGTGIGTTGGGVGISSIPVGIVTNIVITSPGIGYTNGDIINIGSCSYSPILTPNGSIIGITSASSCQSEFIELPTPTINTNTGQGAVLRPVLRYIPQFIVDNPNSRVGLTTDQIINVNLCCDDY